MSPADPTVNHISVLPAEAETLAPAPTIPGPLPLVPGYDLEEELGRGAMEEVAKRAKVGKPTLYKWWPAKATLVLAMICERMAPNRDTPTNLGADESLRFRVRRLIDAFNGPFGKIVAGLIPEGQSEPVVLLKFFDPWLRPRLHAPIADLQRPTH